MPERVQLVAMVDAIVPPPLAAEKAPEQLAQSIRDVARKQGKSGRVFDNIDAAVMARKKGFHVMSDAASRLIVERGVKPVAGGYAWSSDPRLMAASAFKLSEDHIKAFISAVSAPVELFIADSGLPGMLEQQKHVLEWFPQLRLHELEGGHFMHMENQVAYIAGIVNQRVAS
jgi:pimeloyl-ACP methyl ester carboxylesterase